MINRAATRALDEDGPQAALAAQSPPQRLPSGIASVLSVLSSSAVVLDSEDRVLTASSAARSFGLVEGDKLVVGELLALARQVRRDGEIREGEIEVSTSSFNGRTTSFNVRLAPLGAAVGGGGLVLLLAEDQTESSRHRSAPWPCSPRPWRMPPTIRRRYAGSPGGCARRRPGSRIWSRI